MEQYTEEQKMEMLYHQEMMNIQLGQLINNNEDILHEVEEMNKFL